MGRIIRNVIDLHCDTLFECDARHIALKNEELHFSLDKLPEGYRLCQLMAAYIPDTLRGNTAESHFMRLYEVFDLQVKQFGESITKVSDLSAIGQSLARTPFAAILSIEGGAALAGKLENVERFYDLGVRMMTLTWNAENELAGGAATDLGLTGFGRCVIAEMERLGMAVDVSHLSDRGFWELCETAERPFAASHSNSRTICNHRRNLTDEMFKEIARRGGVAGLNYCKGFIRQDGQSGPVDDLLRHVHHFLELGGENTVALGSDFDGASVPDYLGDGIGSIGYLTEKMESSGIPPRVVDKILFDNADRFFTKLAGEAKA